MTSKRGPKRVLVAVTEAGEFLELRRLVPALRQAGVEKMVCFFAYPGYRSLAEHARWCEDNGLDWMDFHGRSVLPATMPPPPAAAPAGKDAAAAPLRRPRSRPLALAEGRMRVGGVLLAAAGRALGEMAAAAVVPLRQLARETAAFARDLYRLSGRRRVARAVLARARPDLLLLGYEHVAADTAVLIREARRRAVPVALVPYALAHLRGQCEPLKRVPELAVAANALNRAVARIFPHWVVEYEGLPLLRLRGSRILALEACGLSYADPWMPNTGFADLIAVDSPRARDRLVADGADPARLRVTGLPIHDRLAAGLAEAGRRRAELCAAHGLDPSRRLVLCAWPSNQITPSRPNAEFGSYARIGETWAGVLAEMRDRYGAGVLVSVHPKALPEDVAAAVAAGLTVTRQDTADLVPLCDLMVGSVTSVIGWALACGKPVINYDVYHYRYGDFTAAPGVIETEDFAVFAAAAARLCSDEAEYRRLAEAQRQAAGDWGIVDGKAVERILGALGNM